MRGWYSTLVAAAAFALPVSYAAADSIVQIGGGFPPPGRAFGNYHPIFSTTVEIRATERPGAVAEVHYRNAAVNQSESDDGWYQADWNGIAIDFYFDHNAYANGHVGSEDLVTVIPPDWLYCEPSCEMLLHESTEDTIYLVEESIPTG